MDTNTSEFITTHIVLLRMHVERIVEGGFFDESNPDEFRHQFAEWMIDFIADMIHDDTCTLADAIGISPAAISGFFESWAFGILLDRQAEIQYQRSCDAELHRQA